MLAGIPSATLHGVDGRRVVVEVHVSNGLPAFTVVGLPDAAVRESRDRVRAAILSSGLDWPLRRITVNLAPSGERKGGAGLDLPIAVGVLCATGVLPPDIGQSTGFVGELGLDGSLRVVPGAVALVAALEGLTVAVPVDAVPEASLVAGERVRGAPSLRELVDALCGRRPWPPPPPPAVPPVEVGGPDLVDIRGQAVGRRALEVAAAGHHHLLLVGPPGSGKTMLARRLPGLLPDLTPGEALEVARIHSSAGLGRPGGLLPRRPPFRAPHHGTTDVALAGGGFPGMRPGELSLAHHGVLFLDELGEFRATVLDMLRQPLEDEVVRVSRARAQVELPARVLLAAAMNPCPCGEGTFSGSCRCSDGARARYGRRLSAPLLDRFDLAVGLGRPAIADLLGLPDGESSAAVAKRVGRARRRAEERGVAWNAAIPADRLDELAPLDPAAAGLLERRLRSGALSARGLHRVRRVARTVADLDPSLGPASKAVTEEHVAEALALRAGRGALLARVRP